MAKLSRVTLELLDHLCAMHHHRCRVKKLHTAELRDSLWSLRYAGLVEFGSFTPSPWAIADWRQRKDIQTPDPLRIPDPADSPEPEASSDGGAAARDSMAAPPETKSRFHLSMDERAKRFEASRIKVSGSVPGSALAAEIDRFLASSAAKGLSKTRLSLWLFGSPSGVERIRNVKKVSAERADRVRAFLAEPDPKAWHQASHYKNRNSDGASGTARKASSADGSPSASRITDRAPIAEPASPVDIKVNSAAPLYPESLIREGEEAKKLDVAFHRRSSAKTRSLVKQARERIDQGLSAGSVKPGALRATQVALERHDADLARMACPIETAKTVLRRIYTPVIGAEIVDGSSGKGFFYVGPRRVSEAELLAMAEKRR